MSKDQVLLQAFSRRQSIGMTTGVSLGPEQEQQKDSEPDTQPEPNQETPEPRDGTPPQALIELRIKQLHNRRFLLLKMQRFRKSSEDKDVGTTNEMSCENSDQLCELEAVQKELEELLVQKEELEKQGNRSKLRKYEGQQDACPTYYKTEIPRGGIYMLPPPQLTQEDVTLEQGVKTTPVAETSSGPVVPVDSLGQTPEITKCPSCEAVVFTETRSRVGESSCIVCCLCTMAGCVAGCCLIPFFMSRLKSVHHHCPQCQTHLHTHQPF